MISFSIDKQRGQVNAEWMSRPVDSFKNQKQNQLLVLVLTSMEQSPTFAYRLKRKLLSGPIFGGAYTNTSTAACNYQWTVTNGEIQGGFLNGNVSTFNGGNQVQIKWFDTTQGGSVQITANCNPSSGNDTKSVNIPILSINGFNPGAITGDDNVTVNVTANKVYSISQINFPNIGSGDVNPKQVNGYEWEIPAGWTVVSGGNTKSITVTPDN